MRRGQDSYLEVVISTNVAVPLFLYLAKLQVFVFMAITDLKTMSKRVESELYYVTFDMFVADVRRMFNNARTYNSPETIYYKCATRYKSPFILSFHSSLLFVFFFIKYLQPFKI